MVEKKEVNLKTFPFCKNCGYNLKNYGSFSNCKLNLTRNMNKCPKNIWKNDFETELREDCDACFYSGKSRDVCEAVCYRKKTPKEILG